MIFLLTAPGVPENVQMVIRNDMKDVYLIIRWDPPTFVGGILLNYNVSVISEVRLTLLFNFCSKYSTYKKSDNRNECFSNPRESRQLYNLKNVTD